MKRKVHISAFQLTSVLIMALPTIAQAQNQHELIEDESTGRTDSIQTIRSISQNSEQGSFFNGVIPLAPQAAALARYSEYPVSHTTGVPDITIPIYEIQLGGFTLPISISYHASGCRVDEVPTCVGLGRPSVLAKAEANTSGKYLYSAVTYDNLGRELRNVMPAAGGNSIEEKKASEVLTMTTSTYGDSYAYSENSYDALDRQVKTTTPGQAWHDAGEKGKVTEYVGNAASSVRLYSAPMGTISLVENGYYAASTLQGVRTVDEDGNEMTVYTDRLGRKVLERRGPESEKGKNDTYFVYNDLGQLRYVLSPGYELSGYKDKFAYEYRYDEHGNVVKKFIPGGGYTQFWYDRAGRMTFMQDENLRAQNLHRLFIYDRAGRQALQGTTAMCNRSSSVNFADYTGGTSGFQSTGYTLQDASRIQQVTLETVNYYDDYRFASALDSRLVQTTSVSAKGLGTGSVTYNSEGGKSMSAIYYDIRGNVTSLREITDFGTLRVTDNTYTFTNQPLTTKMTESGGVTMLTENTYDTNSGLLVATDVTVNGVKQRVSKVTYDDLGRIKSVVRGNGANSGGTVSYAYNLHGQTTAINGPGFTQKLHYTDGPGKPLYNGSISSMLWTMGSDATQRGYKYTYNGYNWLTLAEYGEGSTLSSHKDRYTERFSEFMFNGGIRRLQRHGLKADGNYGKIDNLHISYNGNRITTVLEDADPVTQSGSMDYPGEKREMSFGYNDWGALVSDESRGIESIEYDCFGNPVHIKFSGRDYTKNVYSATGVKLATEHYTHPLQTGPFVSGDEFQPDIQTAGTQSLPGIISPEHHLLAGQQKIEYRGPVIYRNFKVDMVLFPGGYATIGNDNAVTFHYYTQDYLGNNRAVVNGSTGAVEQTTAYYPYGAVIPDLGTGNSGQPFKFGGKELVSANGINEFDYGARRLYPALPGFTTIDNKCEKFSWLSPYIYCGNDPVNGFDKDGNEWKYVQAPIKSFVWVEKTDARDATGNLLPNHYEQAIIFTAIGEDGKTFEPKDHFNIGSSTAVVCKADGSTEKFDACTNPSNSEKYATIPEGNYEAKVGLHKQRYTALRVSDVGTENFNSSSIELGAPNPSNPKTTKARGINIHKPGKKNFTGEVNDKIAISQGCLLIDRSNWNNFINIFNNPEQKDKTIGISIER